MLRKCATTLPSFGEQEGRHLVLGVHPMLMVDTDAVAVERLLLSGGLACPRCGGVLRPWGHARWRSSRQEHGTVRHRPRRASCTGCAKTHVLLAAAWLSRRADAVSVIGSALLAKAAGAGHRSIAAAVGRPASTVRGWLRRFGARAEQVRVLFTRLLHSLDPQAGPLVPRESVFADALEALGRAGAAGVRRPAGSRWSRARWSFPASSTSFSYCTPLTATIPRSTREP